MPDENEVAYTSTKWEAETSINFNDEEMAAEIYTASPRVYGLLTRRGLEPYRTDVYRGKPRGWFFTLPRWTILIKPENKTIRVGGRRANSVAPDTAPSA